MNMTVSDNPILPSRSRAYSLRQHMRARWRHSALQLIEHTDHPERRMARAYVDTVERPRPQDYAACFQWSLLPEAAGRPDALGALATDLLVRAAEAPGLDSAINGPRLSNFSKGFYGDESLQAMGQWLASQSNEGLVLSRVDIEHYPAQCAMVRRALRCLSQLAPEVHDDLTQIVSDVVLCVAQADPSLTPGPVRSLCSFGVWGAVFLNVQAHQDELDYLVSVVFEGARLGLLAWNTDQPTQGLAADAKAKEGAAGNGLTEPDRRVQAAFATARLALVLQRLQERTVSASVGQTPGITRRRTFATPWTSQRLLAEQQQAVERFWALGAALEQDSALSPEGQALMHHCCSFMADTFGWPAGLKG